MNMSAADDGPPSGPKEKQMAEKAKTFGDDDAYSRVLTSSHPSSAKQIGREIKSYDDAVWSKARYAVVVAGSVAKFTQNIDLKESLLETGDKVLVEASPFDPIWGIGLGAEDPMASNPLHWKGDNLLGFALMDAREAIGSASQ